MPVLLILVGAAAVAIRLLPVWVILLSVSLFVLGVLALLKWGLLYVLPQLLKLPFRAKGAVLRNAGLLVHSIERIGAGDDRSIYRLELSVVPREPTGKFRLWAPAELIFVGADARPNDPDRDTEAERREIEILEAGEFVGADRKYEGAHRLRAVIDVPSNLTSLRVRYYFEVFGEITLPGRALGPSVNGRPLERVG